MFNMSATTAKSQVRKTHNVKKQELIA